MNNDKIKEELDRIDANLKVVTRELYFITHPSIIVRLLYCFGIIY